MYHNAPSNLQIYSGDFTFDFSTKESKTQNSLLNVKGSDISSAALSMAIFAGFSPQICLALFCQSEMPKP
jgi:hypothetical protein